MNIEEERKYYCKKIDEIIASSFNSEQKQLAKEIINSSNEHNIGEVYRLITRRVKTGFVFDEAPEVRHDCVCVIEENKELNINVNDNGLQDKIEHKLIIGENFDALRNLLVTYKGLIDVIYIDPPYNTEKSKEEGNNYKDNVEASKFVYRDKFTRDGWLNMMNERLKLAKKLLSDKGVIFISIDDSEQAYLKVLCDEIFGEENFVGCAPRKTRSSATTKSDAELQNLCDYLLIYYRDKSNMDATFNKKFVGKKTYPYNDERGDYYIVPLQDNGPHGTRIARPNLYYPIYQFTNDEFSLNKPSTNDFVEFLPSQHKNQDGRWMWSKQKFETDKKDLVCKDGKIFIKHYFFEDEDQNKYQREKLWLEDFQNAKGTIIFNGIFPEKKGVFENPKPVELIKWCLRLANGHANIILDFFAGSGTTGQAVMELNEEDGGMRKFILATNNENNIATDITRERLFRVINGVGSKGEKIQWGYSKTKKSLTGNSVRVFDVKNYKLTLENVNKAEELSKKTQQEFKKLNENYEQKDFNIYYDLASLHPFEEEN